MSAGADPLVSRHHTLNPNARRTAMATALRKAGEFCWINMLTPRPAEAMEFFAAVGWTPEAKTMPGFDYIVSSWTASTSPA
jgi:hypothetical protein